MCKLKRDLQYFNFLFVTLIYFIEVYFVWCVQANILCFYDRCTRSCYGVTLLPICNMHFHEFMHLFCMQNQHKNQLSVQYAYNFSHGLIYMAKGICIDRKNIKSHFYEFLCLKMSLRLLFLPLCVCYMFAFECISFIYVKNE